MILPRVRAWRVWPGCLDIHAVAASSCVRLTGTRRWRRFRNRWANQLLGTKEFHDICSVFVITSSLMFFDRCRVCVSRPAVLLSCCVHVYHLRRGCNAIGSMDGASLLSARVVVSGTVRSDVQLSYNYDRTSAGCLSAGRQDCHVSVLVLPAVYSKASTIYC